MLIENPSSTKSSSLDSHLVSAAFIQGTREEAPDCGVQYLHCSCPVSVPAPAHLGNITHFVQTDLFG